MYIFSKVHYPMKSTENAQTDRRVRRSVYPYQILVTLQ